MDIQRHHLPSPQPLNWKDLNDERKVIKGFFKSLNNENTKVYMSFNTQKFALEPRRSGLRKQKGGRFTSIQSGFIQLEKKIESLTVTIKSFHPEPCPREALAFFYGLRKIEAIVESHAKFGLNNLCWVYTEAKKTDKAGSLKRLGESAFGKLDETIGLLREKITPYFPEQLQIDCELHKLLLPIASHMRKSGDCLIHLDEVTWNEKDGVCAPFTLFTDWCRDARLTTKYPEIATGASYLNAANLIQVSQSALSLPVQQGFTKWSPLRPIHQKGEVDLVNELEGVTGTYERKMGVKDLCNVYFREGDGCISTSAIDTPLKASQISAVIKHVLKSVDHPNGRWILHQLNSFFSETNLIKNVHSQIPSIEEELQDEQSNITLLHINTPFNAATKLYWENTTSVTTINIDSLAQFAYFVMEDVDKLLDLSNKGLPEWNKFQQCIAAALKLAQIIKMEKIRRNQVLVSQQPSSSESLQPSSSESVNASTSESHNASSIESMQITVRDESSGEGLDLEEPSDEGIGDLILSGSLVLADDGDLLENKEPPVSLSKMQKELKAALRIVYDQIVELKMALQTETDLKAEKTHLILDVFQTLLSLQLEIKGKPVLSRCSEVELFLLLDRLLNIKRIISCYSGLDRTNTVVAMDDSLECLLNSFKQFHRQQLDDNDDREQAAEIKAYKNLFQLISNIDENRAQLIQLGNESLKAVSPKNVIASIDKKVIVGSDEKVDLRQLIIQKIDQAHALTNQPFEPSILKYTHIYLELMTKHLLTTQIKTFSSTGLLGYCWHWQNWLSPNPHPKQRLVQFINVGGIYVQLTYPESYIYDSVTNAAIQIFCRLSPLRGV